MTGRFGRYRAFAVVASLALVVGACGFGTPPTSTPGTGSGGQTAAGCGDSPITLNVWGGYPELDAVYKEAGEAFKKTHPNVDFTVFSTDLRGFEQKLTTAIPSGTAGDVIVRTTNFLARFIDEDFFQPVPDDIKSAVTGGGYKDAVVEDNTYADNIWGMPLFTGGTAIFYNTDMYDEAGISGPPTSMDMLIENAKKLAVVGSDGTVTRSGMSLRLSGQGSGIAEKFWILLLQSGKTLIRESSDGKWHAEYNSPEGAQLLQMYVDFLRDKVTSQDIEQDAAAFEKKLAAQFLRESWVVADIAANAPDLVGHYATVAPPVGDILTVESMFVPTASANADCAWEFIRFMREPEQQILLVTVSGWLPARSDLDLTGFLADNPTFSGFFEKPDDFQLTTTPPIAEFDEIETKLATHLADAYADYQNLAGNPDKIQALLDDWAAETNQILKDNDHYGE